MEAAIVALDLKTGKRKWHFQAMHHDIWDADIAVPPILYEIEMDGKMRKGVAVMRPDGYLFLLDRVTGQPLVPDEERPVPQNERSKTAKTQPFPVGGETLLPDCSYWRDKIPTGFVCEDFYFPPSFPPPSTDPQNVLSPMFLVRSTPMSYDPRRACSSSAAPRMSISAGGPRTRGSSLLTAASFPMWKDIACLQHTTPHQ